MNIRELIENPSESLAVEIKPWTDPSSTLGKATIIKTALAMKNNNGGYIIFGFNNVSFQPITTNVPSGLTSKFHIDKIQGMITKYSSAPFEVTINFPEREGQIHPVIEIPSGVESPVATKSTLKEDDGRDLIELNEVYVRSLNVNNTPSTTEATWKDWPTLVRICFDNREADIGGFFRRQLSSVSPDDIRQLIEAIKNMDKQKRQKRRKMKGSTKKKKRNQ